MELLFIRSTMDELLSSIVYLAIAFVLFLIGKLVYPLFHKGIKVNHELVEKDNLAFSFSIIGYYTGLLLVIGSAIVGPSNGILYDLVDIGSYGLLAIVLLNLAAIINDKVIFGAFSMKKEIIDDQNAGTGIIEGANHIATGLIINGAVVGEGGGFFTAIAIWLIAQVILIVASLVYNWITPYNIHEHIEKDNVAVGIGYAGALVAIANLIRNGVTGDFPGWEDLFWNIGLGTVLGLILLPVVRLLTDKILLPGQKLTDEIVNQEKPNHGAALTEAFAYIGGSILLCWCL